MKLRASGVVTTHSSERDRKIVAVHEAGHAVVSVAVGKKVSKVSIIPYSSGIGGMTVEDTDDMEGKNLRQKSDILMDLKVLLAGKVAEELIFGESSSGSSNDIERASLIAYNYVTTYGMDDNLLLNTDIISRTNNVLIDNKLYVDRANKLLLEQRKEVEKSSTIIRIN